MRPMTERDARQWRAIALYGAAACGLLTARLLTGRRAAAAAESSWKFAREYFSGKRPLVDDDPFSETWDQAIVRRLEACEAHLVDLEERFGPIDQYIGDAARHAMGHRDA